MATKPANWNKMSPEDRALWEYLNAGEEFTQGGAPEYDWLGDLQYEQLGSAPQLGQTDLANVSTDPRLLESQMKALAALEQQADTGLSVGDENALNRTSRKLAADASANAATIEQRMARQGRAGGRLGVTMQMQAAQAAQQAAADDAAQRNAMSQEGRMQARLGAGQMAGNMSAEEYKRKAAAAQAQDVINRFNAQNTIGRQELNNRLANQATQANWQGRQENANQNTRAGYDFRKDRMGVQQGNASAALEKSNQDYNRRQLEKQQKRARNAGLGSAIGGIAGGIAGAYAGGPAGASAGYSMGSGLGGAVGGYAQGGKIPGVAPFPGDDPRNDMYTAQVSADEIIVPRTAAQDPATAAAFAADAASDPFASIKNPTVREFMKRKFAAQKGLDDAQKSQDMMGYANLAGKAVNDFANSQKQDVILKTNFLAGKNLKPGVVEADRPSYDGSMLDKLGAQGVQRAKDGLGQADSDMRFIAQQERDALTQKLQAERWAKEDQHRLSQLQGQDKDRAERERHNRAIESLTGKRALGSNPNDPLSSIPPQLRDNYLSSETKVKEFDTAINDVEKLIDQAANFSLESHMTPKALGGGDYDSLKAMIAAAIMNRVPGIRSDADFRNIVEPMIPHPSDPPKLAAERAAKLKAMLRSNRPVNEVSNVYMPKKEEPQRVGNGASGSWDDLDSLSDDELEKLYNQTVRK
jgi:hypothetical protein